MKAGDEYSEGGSKIVRHTALEPASHTAGCDRSFAPEVEAHLAQMGAVAETVLHELASDAVHVDVHLCPPNDERGYWTLFTTGMSDLPMATPAEFENFARAEVLLCLPPDWPMEEDWTDSERFFWPVRLLKYLARFPHAFQTWLGAWHTIPNGSPPQPFAESTKLAGALLAPPATLPEAQHVVATDAGEVHLLGVIPLHADEMNFKLAKGLRKLCSKLDDGGVTELLRADRPSCIRKRIFGLF